MKYIIIVPDGMSDHPIEELNNKTPLEAAITTNMDFMAQNGMSGLIQTIPDKLPPGSDVGNMSIMGYDPEQYLTGRAPLEAANQNIILEDNEIVFRCNLVTLRDDIMEDYSAGHISTKEAEELIKELNNDLQTEEIRFVAGKSYRHLLILKVRDPKTYQKIKTVPPHDILNQDVDKYLPNGPESEMLLRIMERAKEVLDKSSINNVRIDLGENPGNAIWLWGQGTKPQLPKFQDKYGIDGSVISAVDLVNGIGRLANLEIIDVPGITGYYDTNFAGKAEYAIQSLKEKDYVYIHIEAPDEAGHNGDYQAKVKAIEDIDKHIVGAILNHFDSHDHFRVLVLPDHPTPVKIRTHTHEPVCFAMYGKGIAGEGHDNLSEKTAQEIGLRFKSGEEMIEYFIRRNLK